MTGKLRVVLMASGRGSNALNLAQKMLATPEHWQVVGLLCDQPKAAVIEKFQKLNIPTVHLDYTKSKKEAETQLKKYLLENSIDLIFLAGFMRVLSAHFVESQWDHNYFRSKIINIHPSLLPKYPGLNSYERALENGDKVIGATVHFVDQGVDTGPIITQQAIYRRPQESSQEFMARALELEHRLYTYVLELIERRVLNQGRLVRLSDYSKHGTCSNEMLTEVVQ